MTTEQLIEEILLEADGLGIRQMVLEESEKYIDEGVSRLDAIELAFSELVEEAELNEYDDDDIQDWNDVDIENWGDDDDDDPDADFYSDDEVYDDDDDY